VWTHFDEDLDILHGDVKEVTITFDHPLGKNFYYILDIDRGGKQRALHEHFQSIHLKTRYVSEYNNNTSTEDLVGYLRDISDSNKYQASVNETKVETYKYDNQGRIIKYLKIGGAETGKSCAYKYNSFGDLIECDVYDDKQRDSKTTFKYDTRHLITESLRTEFEIDSSIEKTSYQYKNFDSMNNWRTKIIKSEDGKSNTVTRKITYY
jgi:hypothetical protein